MLGGRAWLRRFKHLRSDLKQVNNAWCQSERQSHQDGNANFSSLEEEAFELNYELYASHVPTTITQKLLLGIGSSVLGLLDPRRGGKEVLISSLVKIMPKFDNFCL